MENEYNNVLGKLKNITVEEIDSLSPLQLAYLGDAVYELLVRTYIININRNLKVQELHQKATEFVSAKAQSDIIHKLEKYLTEEEMGIVKRGRNAKINSHPKNFSVLEYKYATGFETLIGYLYLKGQEDRIIQLFSFIV
ncbi:MULTISPECIES: Mini-ribonuclease 3 [Tissierellales]|jgi:ribonuclease-3 family protein|uniref:Mini-ribonuclease 3 n=1 Tax=Acidilutibacter cellobiosedens TaxID=2507161 RepID=A0A410QF44_9FIRM|nr:MULTISPECIES: ribonuclease III domain-containing protein [Tissierellales]MBE6082533.1 Mini-ribonuclease 3 [Tissierellaceae bacterium]QAT62693.1 Mini-ribonuclease 3 [Acidilutibacter cellobiosedens]SCL89968.1 Mini-ribonuclease 3 [Sporanaerobacter sp. PP17-6a]